MSLTAVLLVISSFLLLSAKATYYIDDNNSVVKYTAGSAAGWDNYPPTPYVDTDGTKAYNGT
jgi:hypothetical protein